jgi:membrane fusion protein, heavy metal efflux system
VRFSIHASILLALAALTGCQSQPEPGGRAGSPGPARRPPLAGRIVLPADSPKLKHIQVGSVGTAEFPIDEVIAPGAVETNPNRISRIAVPVAGRITQVFVKLGASVEQGQPLVTVDSLDAGAAIAAWRQAQSQTRSAASTMNKADADLTRLKELYGHKAAALKDFVAAQNDYTQAQAAGDQAASAQQEARHRLELLGLDPAAPSPVVTVRSPIAGKVLEIAVVPGEFRNDTNAALMTIADLSTVWVAANVPESVIRYIEIGEGVEVTLSAYPGETFRARVMRIADVVDPQTRTVKVQAEIANPAGRFRPEMFARIRHSHGSRTVPVVPATAVVESGGRACVFVARGPGEFEKVTVETGEDRDGSVSVLVGVRPGDRIVLDGAMLLEGQAGGID